MNKLIILEGIDGSGKTTIAGMISRKGEYKESRLPYYENKTGRKLKEIIANKKTRISELDFQKLMFENYIETLKMWEEEGSNYVITRGGCSMVAYGSFFDPDNKQIYEKYAKRFLNILKDKNIKVHQFLIDVPLEVSRDRLSKRNEREDIFENDKVLTYVSGIFQDFVKSETLIPFDNTGQIVSVVNSIIKHCKD